MAGSNRPIYVAIIMYYVAIIYILVTQGAPNIIIHSLKHIHTQSINNLCVYSTALLKYLDLLMMNELVEEERVEGQWIGTFTVIFSVTSHIKTTTGTC